MKLKCTKCGEEVEVELTVRWEEGKSYIYGYSGKNKICSIIKSTLSYQFIPTGIVYFNRGETVFGIKEHVQRLFDEWMGGMMDGSK